MDHEMEAQSVDDGATQAPATHYGAARMQQLSGGTTPAAAPPTSDAEGPYGATRIAQLHGIGSDPVPSDSVRSDDAAG